MTDASKPDPQGSPALPPDDMNRDLALAQPDSDPSHKHVAVVGDTYTILISGRQTAGQYALIDMYVPPGGGPPPHRHDFEEMFHVLEGEVEIMFRGTRSIAHAGETVNIPANAPHAFKNVSDRPARLHCMVSPAGAEDFFLAIGMPVATRTSPPPELSEAERAELGVKMKTLAGKFGNEILAL